MLVLHLQTHTYYVDPKFGQDERTDCGVSHSGAKYEKIKQYNIIVTIPHKVFRCCIKSILYG